LVAWLGLGFIPTGANSRKYKFSDFNLAGSLDLEVFQRMVNYCVTTKGGISMKGIIDFEIQRKLNLPYLEIPIFYIPWYKIVAKVSDRTNYEGVAFAAKENAKDYAAKKYNKTVSREEKTTRSYFINFK
jgi:hypothetical protein